MNHHINVPEYTNTSAINVALIKRSRRFASSRQRIRSTARVSNKMNAVYSKIRAGTLHHGGVATGGKR